MSGIAWHLFREQMYFVYFFNKQRELLRSPSSLRCIAFLGTDVCISCVWAEGPRGDLLCTHTDKAVWFDRWPASCLSPANLQEDNKTSGLVLVYLVLHRGFSCTAVGSSWDLFVGLPFVWSLFNDHSINMLLSEADETFHDDTTSLWTKTQSVSLPLYPVRFMFILHASSHMPYLRIGFCEW